MDKGRLLWIVLRGCISLALLAFILSRIDLGSLMQTLRSAQPGLLIGAMAAALGGWAFNTYKWQQLLRHQGEGASFGGLFSLNLIGLFYSLFLPGQLGGEVVKGIKLARAGARARSALVSIALDRLTGVLALAILIIIAIPLAPGIAEGPVVFWTAVGILLLGLSPGLALLLSERPGLVQSLTRLIPSLLKSRLSSLWDALSAYRRDRSVLALAAALSVLFQITVTVSNYLVAQSLGLDMSFLVFMWVVAAVSILHMLPLSLAGIGIREGAYVFLLHRYGVPLEIGLSLSLLVFGIILFQGLLGGILEALSVGPALQRAGE